MINYIVYDSTGTILRTGMCPKDHLVIQAGPSQFVIEGIADDSTDTVDVETKTVKPNSKPAPTPEPAPDLSNEIRARRSRLLSLCDWTQVPDSPLTPEVKALWITYRQALRDITKQPGFPNSITWPIQPS